MKETGAEVRPAVVSGIVTGDASVSYWPSFLPLSPVTVPDVFAKVYSAQFSSRFLSGECGPTMTGLVLCQIALWDCYA